MLHTPEKNRKPKHRWKFRGIVADARALGVNRATLFRVLTGEWISKRLSARYAELKASQAAAATSPAPKS